MASKVCQSCGEKPATVKFVEVVGGEKHTRHFCAECFPDTGSVIDPHAIEEAASHLLESVKEMLGTPIPLQEADIQSGECPGCGLTWDVFRNESRLGCPACYPYFQVEVDGVLERLHGATQHRGRAPKRETERLERRKRSAEIRVELSDAIQGEDYERAARLRDQLRSLGIEMEPDGGTL